MKACINDLGQIYAYAYFDMGSLMKALEITCAKPMDMQYISRCKGGMHLLMSGFASIRHLHSERGLRNLSLECDVSTVGSVKHNLSGKECDKA